MMVADNTQQRIDAYLSKLRRCLRGTNPEDVRDTQALYDFLSDNELHAEGVAYLHDHLERFRTTIAVIPPLPEGAAVLELGSSPYFITRLLVRRGYTVTTSNFTY